MGFTWSTEPQVFLQGETKLTADQGGSHDTTVTTHNCKRETQQMPPNPSSPSHLQSNRGKAREREKAERAKGGESKRRKREGKSGD